MEPVVGTAATREYDDTRLTVAGVVAVVLSQFTPLKVAALAVPFICCWIWGTSAWSLVRPPVVSPTTEVRAVYCVSTVAADRPSESETAESAALSARIDVAI